MVHFYHFCLKHAARYDRYAVQHFKLRCQFHTFHSRLLCINVAPENTPLWTDRQTDPGRQRTVSREAHSFSSSFRNSFVYQQPTVIQLAAAAQVEVDCRFQCETDSVLSGSGGEIKQYLITWRNRNFCFHMSQTIAPDQHPSAAQYCLVVAVYPWLGYPVFPTMDNTAKCNLPHCGSQKSRPAILI